ARTEAVEQQAERNLEQAEGKEVDAGQEAELGRGQAELVRERRPEHGVDRAEHVGKVIPRQERQDYPEDDQRVGASRPPRMNRFQVGLMITSFTHTRGGKPAMNAMVRPRSSGCSIFARTSGDGGTGRFSRIGVAASPGRTDVARMPLADSSM